MNEWKEWHDGDMPVNEDEMVECKYADGGTLSGYAACFDWWHHGNEESDILFYRVIKEQKV